MSCYKEFAIKLYDILGEENVKIDEPMKAHTSFRVGGPADILVTPKDYSHIQYLIKHCNENHIPYFIIGNGSNLLVKDGGIRGVVIKLTRLNKISVSGNNVIVEAGASLSKTSKAAADACLAGFEFAIGIPGSVGGALTMNAGAYNGEISQIIKEALVIDRDGEIKKLSKEELELGYRMSAIIKYGYTILEATFELQNGDCEKIHERINDLTRRRTEKQPLEYPSAGSTFKRPEGYFAAKLIEDSGLKGINIGDAEVSAKHSGFIINKGNANAEDILNLIKKVQETVKGNFNVDLHTEVMIVGEEK